MGRKGSMSTASQRQNVAWELPLWTLQRNLEQVKKVTMLGRDGEGGPSCGTLRDSHPVLGKPFTDFESKLYF